MFLKAKIGNDSYLVVADSVKGQGKIENQDSYKVLFQDETLVIALADGLGSASFSKEGADKAVSIATQMLLHEKKLGSVSALLFSEWKDGLSGELSLYDTTLKFLKLTPESLFAGGVGDGIIALRNKGTIEHFSPEHTFSNQTDSLLSFDLKGKFLIYSFPAHDIDFALLTTDGISEDLDLSQLEDFVKESSNSILQNAEGFEKEFHDLLNNWPIKTNQDDKTGIFVVKETEHE